MKAEKKWKLRADVVKTLRWVQKQILEEPKRFDMGILTEHYSLQETLSEDFVPKCGTVGCIAGWMAFKEKSKLVTKTEEVFDEKKDAWVKKSFRTWKLPKVNEWNYAAKRLGFEKGIAGDYFDAASMFLPEHWPQPFNNQWDKIPHNNKRAQAKLAVKRIDYFIKTGQ